MKILLYASSAREGGGITYVENLLEYFPDDGTMAVDVIVPDKVKLPSNSPFVRRLAPEVALDNLSRRVWWEKTRLRRLLRSQQYDVLFCPGGTIPVRVRDVKTVVTFQNMLPFDTTQRKRFPLGAARSKWFLLRHLLGKSLRTADLAIFISAYGEQVIRDLGIPVKRSVRILHGIDDVFRESEPSLTDESDWLPASGYILYVSAFDYYKSHVELVRAYDITRRRREISQKLVLIGPDRRGYRRLVEQEIADRGLQDRVIIRDEIPRDALPNIYARADACAFPSECENCPFILLEMLAAGAPTACSNCPPMPELADDAVTYFDPKDENDIADALERVLCDPKLRTQLASNARQRSELFRWANCADQTWRAIAQLKGQPEADRAVECMC